MQINKIIFKGVRLEIIAHQKVHPQQMELAVENIKKPKIISGAFMDVVFLSFIGTYKICFLFMVAGVSGVSGVNVHIRAV